MKIYSDLNQVKVPGTAQFPRQGVGPAERAQQHGVWKGMRLNQMKVLGIPEVRRWTH